MRNKKARHNVQERFIHICSQKYNKLRRKKKKKSRNNSRINQESIFQSRKKRNFFGTSLNITRVLPQTRGPVFYAWGIIFFFIIISFIFLGPLLKIKSIYITRQGHTINIEQAYASSDYTRGKNIFLLDTRELANRLQKNQSAIQNIEFTFESLNTLNISLRAYPTVFQSDGYLILSNGSVLQGENKLSGDIPELSLSEEISEFSIFRENLNTEEIKNISLILEGLPKNIPGLLIQKSHFQVIEKELLVSNEVGSIFIFDLSGDSIENQIEKLAVFQKESEDISQKKYIYIDVRIPGKLFICGYDEEFTCRENLKNIYGESIFSQFVSQSQQ